MTQPDADQTARSTIKNYMQDDVQTVTVNVTLKEVSQVFAAHGVGAVLVKDGKNYVGIVSDKRLTREGIAKGLNAETTPVRAIMRANMLTIETDRPVREAQTMMKSHGVHHLVVTEQGGIVGIVSITDLIRFYTDFFDE